MNFEPKTHVTYDCRPNEIVRWDDANWRVADTFPNHVRLEKTTNLDSLDATGEIRNVSYSTLHEAAATYVTNVIVIH